MLERILVPLDGSPFGERAIPIAYRLVRLTGGRLLLAHVRAPAHGLAHGHRGAHDDGDDTGGVGRASARDYVETTADRVRRAVWADVDTAVLGGDVAAALHDAARDAAIELVVMTSHERGPLARFLLGSVAERIAHLPGVPVIVARGHVDRDDPEGGAVEDALDFALAAAAADPTPPFHRILVALDGSPLAEAVVAPASRIAAVCGAPLTLAAVRDPVLALASLAAPADPGFAGGVSDAYLDGVARHLLLAGHDVRLRILSDRQPAHAIVRCADEEGADLVALATHSGGGLARALRGSVADRVLHAGKGTVMIYAADERAARAGA